MPAYTSASGLGFLVFWQHEQRLLNRQRYPFGEYGAHAWETEGRLESLLEQVRSDGYVLAPERQTGLHRFAVPIFSATHHLFGALGLALPVDGEVDLESLKPSLVSRLVDAAKEIANGNGATSSGT